jgi:hypothetical protein
MLGRKIVATGAIALAMTTMGMQEASAAPRPAGWHNSAWEHASHTERILAKRAYGYLLGFDNGCKDDLRHNWKPATHKPSHPENVTARLGRFAKSKAHRAEFRHVWFDLTPYEGDCE